ncbi:hypothetical protein D9M69_428790 [compost metagenome]
MRWGDGGLQFFAGPDGKCLGQADENLPVVQCTLGFGEDGAVETADVAHREQVERGVVMVVFQRRCGRQDQVGVTRGFIDVQVDTDHELQPVQRLFELSAIGCGQHRIARHGDQRADLPFPFSEHLFGQRRDR